MNTRPIIIAGNWKMNKLRQEAGELASAIARGLEGLKDLPVVILCPPFTCLDVVVEAVRNIPVAVGAQNMDHRPSGAFTGEVAPPMLVDAGVKYVIIGHSERRQFFGETDEGVNLKLKAALSHKLAPIVCVGETLGEREKNLTDAVVQRQVTAALAGLQAQELPWVTIAYEPVWAIGTGKVCESGEADRVIKLIRQAVADTTGSADAAARVPILYGGSVNAANADELLARDDIDGALVGGASLKADEFLSIIESGTKSRLSVAK